MPSDAVPSPEGVLLVHKKIVGDGACHERSPQTPLQAEAIASIYVDDRRVDGEASAATASATLLRDDGSNCGAAPPSRPRLFPVNSVDTVNVDRRGTVRMHAVSSYYGMADLVSSTAEDAQGAIEGEGEDAAGDDDGSGCRGRPPPVRPPPEFEADAAVSASITATADTPASPITPEAAAMAPSGRVLITEEEERALAEARARLKKLREGSSKRLSSAAREQELRRAMSTGAVGGGGEDSPPLTRASSEVNVWSARRSLARSSEIYARSAPVGRAARAARAATLRRSLSFDASPPWRGKGNA